MRSPWMIKWVLTPVTIVLIRDRGGGNTDTRRRDTVISGAERASSCASTSQGIPEANTP